jgi:hypothetical protein
LATGVRPVRFVRSDYRGGLGLQLGNRGAVSCLVVV